MGVSSLFSSILNVLNMSELGIGEALVCSMYKPAAFGDTLMMNKLLSVYNMFYKLFGLIIFFIGVKYYFTSVPYRRQKIKNVVEICMTIVKNKMKK